MAFDNYVCKVLGNKRPAAGILTDLYTVPVGKIAILGCLFVCNTAGGSTVFRISVAPGGIADDLKQYIYYDQNVTATSTFEPTPPSFNLHLSSGDVVRCRSGNGSISFTLSGMET